MDAIFVEGVAATISALLVFCGSVWLLLSMVMGVRLAYLVTASVTLGFLFIMGIVWSLSPLGPVGALAEWEQVSLALDQGELEGPSVDSYPEGPWREPNTEDEAESTLASDLESDATSYLEEQIDAGEITEFSGIEQAVVTEESARLLEVDGESYGAVQFEPAPAPEEAQEEEEEEEAPIETLEVPPPPSPEPTPAGALPPEDTQVFAVMQLNEGNPLGQARMITVGALVLLALHLFGLGRAEKRSRTLAERLEPNKERPS
ncbi:MAG: hypothetical protein ACRDKZ_05620 [Actinomycetota bacterium]